MRAEYAAVERFVRERKFLPGGRYLYASGRDLHQTQNCLLLRAEDSREGWSELTYKATMALMTGAGIGIDYGRIRPKGSPIKRTGGEASGPLSLMQIINEAGRHIQQGGARRSAIWAGLPWSHPDVLGFIRAKDWDAETKRRKELDFNAPAPLDMTNVSVQLDDDFFAAYGAGDPLARRVYDLAVKHMVENGEPGFSIDTGANAGETLRNACTEITSADDSDICNLGSINLSRIESLDELREVTHYATLFLLAGTVYSHVPYPLVDAVRQKNRRLGLGLMGVHEWLLQRGRPYGPDPELARWLDVWRDESRESADHHADLHGLSRPLKVRSIAPTGTIGIIGETTTGIEPILCVAYKRRYKEARAGEGDITHFQYVIDPTAKRLVARGVDPANIEDAHTIPVERRVAFQAWIQKWVDHAVSSTINIPAPITDPNAQSDFGQMLIKHLPDLRGITCYPSGARGGQPITPVPYEAAVGQQGVAFIEQEDRCSGGSCGV